MSNKEIVLKLTKCTLVLYEPEILQMLSSNPILFENCIKRGKMFRRCETAAARAVGQEIDNPWHHVND